MRRSGICAVFLVAALPMSHAEGGEHSRFVNLSGVSIHYVERGASAMPERTLLFLHGWCGTSVDFLPLVRSMPGDVRCIAVDMPGCGLSDAPDMHYSVPAMVDFLHAFARAVGLTRFVLVAHSMGGLISIHFALDHPDMVERMFLFAPDGIKGEEGGMRILAKLGPITDFGLSLGRGAILQIALRRQIFYRGDVISKEFSDAMEESLANADRRRAIIRQANEIIGTDPVDGLLPRLSKKVRIVWGREDRVLAFSYSARFMERLPNAELLAMPSCGHMAMMEYREESAAYLLDFIGDGLSPSASPAPSSRPPP
jgi:2-hydroxy-6-oxo-6-(2'-aminophenyl)hexa-2,4-dienoate hydrolase